MALRIDRDKQKEVIVREAAKRIGIPLTYHSSHTALSLYAKDEKGFFYVIICTSGYGNGINVRGVVRQQRRNTRLCFLGNGQASTGGRQIGWWEEKCWNEPDSDQNFYIPGDEWEFEVEVVDGELRVVDR